MFMVSPFRRMRLFETIQPHVIRAAVLFALEHLYDLLPEQNELVTYVSVVMIVAE